MSKPPTLHSPLSLVKIEETRTFPCTEEASSLMNLSVFYAYHKDGAPFLNVKHILQLYTDPISKFPRSSSSAGHANLEVLPFQ